MSERDQRLFIFISLCSLEDCKDEFELRCLFFVSHAPAQGWLKEPMPVNGAGGSW